MANIMHHAALLVILHLEMAQDSRQLSDDEIDLCSRLKWRAIALAILERARKNKFVGISNLKQGDANTNFFHCRVNARRCKNHTHRIKHNLGWVTEHSQKEDVIHDLLLNGHG